MSGPDAASSRPSRPTARPDPRPSRLVVGAGALAALSVMAAGLVRFPVSDLPRPDETAAAPVARTRRVKVERPVRYVRLRAGQQAPPGARVIEEDAPAPRIVIRHVTPPARATVRRATVRTRQSGGR
jgi:hypothetical protein